jgi:hypothetical protein
MKAALLVFIITVLVISGCAHDARPIPPDRVFAGARASETALTLSSAFNYTYTSFASYTYPAGTYSPFAESASGGIFYAAPTPVFSSQGAVFTGGVYFPYSEPPAPQFWILTGTQPYVMGEAPKAFQYRIVGSAKKGL